MQSSAQPPDPKADLWATEVVPQLPAETESQAYQLKAFIRKRKLEKATDLLRALLAYVLSATSFRHLASRAVVTNLGDLSPSAWLKRLRKSSAWLLWLHRELLAPPSPQPSRSLFPQAKGSNILLVDATRLKQRGGKGDDWVLHTAINLTVGRLVQVTVTTREGGEHLGYKSIQPGDIVVADNGYGYRRSIATLRKQQAHGVLRIYPPT